MSPIQDDQYTLWSRIQNNPKLKVLFKKKGWLRIYTECGEFVGNTAGWIVHTLWTHMEKEQAEVEPNSTKQLILFRRNRHDDWSGDDRTPAPSAPSSIVARQVSSSESQKSDDGSKYGIGPELLLHPFLSQCLPVKVSVKGGMAGPNQVSSTIPGKDKEGDSSDDVFDTLWTQLESAGYEVYFKTSM